MYMSNSNSNYYNSNLNSLFIKRFSDLPEYNSNVPQSLRNLGIISMDITRLDLKDRGLTSIPKEIGNFKNLNKLYLSSNNLTSLPKEIGNLKTLTLIDLSINNLTSIPEEFGKLKNLIHLNLGTNKLRIIPPAIGNLKNLEVLNLWGNKLRMSFESDPRAKWSTIENLKNLIHFRIGNNMIKMVPPVIFKFKKLEKLNLSDNELKSIPPKIGNLKNLKRIYLYNNLLSSLPDEINNLTNLERLDVTRNPLLRIIPKTLNRGGLEVIKNSSTRFERKIVRKPIQRKNVPLNTNRNDPISGHIFRVGNNALNLGYNKYLTEKSLLNWIKTKNNKTNITNINTLYSLNSNENVVINPFTRQPLLRKNLNFVKFVKSNKPNTPNTLAKNLNKTKINNKPNKPNTIRKKAGNATQNRRTNRN